MHYTRAIERCGEWSRRAIALLFFLPFSGCRDVEPIHPPPGGDAFVLLAGDRFVYDVWTTNVWGTPLDTSLTRMEWEVLSSDPGGTGIVTIARTRTPIPPRPVSMDTIQLRSTTDGRIEWRGFLAELIARREQRSIPVRWDTLAELQGNSWRVGSLDSAGTVRITGSYAASPEYVSLVVDGESLIISSRHVELTANSLEYDLWVSTNPPCFPLWEEFAESYIGIYRGSRGIIREALLVPGPRN